MDDVCSICGEKANTWWDNGQEVSDMGLVMYDGIDGPGKPVHNHCLGPQAALWRRLRKLEKAVFGTDEPPVDTKE